MEDQTPNPESPHKTRPLPDSPAEMEPTRPHVGPDAAPATPRAPISNETEGPLSFSQRPVVARVNSSRSSFLRRSPTVGLTIVNPFLRTEQDAQLLITAEHGLFILLLSLIFVVRIASLNFNTLHLDEAIYTTVGKEALSGTFDQGATRWMFGSYLYPVLATIVDRAGGVIGLRALSALLSTVAAVFVYLTTRRVFGKQPALWALLVFGLTGTSINLGQFAVVDALGVPLLAATLYCVVSAMQKLDRQKAYLTWAGILFSLSVLAKYIGLLALPGLLFVMLVLHLYEERDPLAFMTKVPWLSFFVPIVIILGIYGAFYFRDLQEVMTGQFASQPASRAAILTEIVQAIGVPVLFSLITIPMLSQKAFSRLRVNHPALLVLFLGSLPLVFFAIYSLPLYHLITANTRSLWKHLVYCLVFVAPLAGLGIAQLLEYARSLSAKYTRLRLVSAVVTALGLFLFVTNALQQNADFHTSWPNSRGVIEFMQSQKLTPQSKVLSSSYAIYDYYFKFGVKDSRVWSNVWYTEYAALTGVDAVKKAIQDCTFDMVVWDDYYAPELEGVLEPLVQQAGYVLKYTASETLSTKTATGTRVYLPAGGNQCKRTQP